MLQTVGAIRTGRSRRLVRGARAEVKDGGVGYGRHVVGKGVGHASGIPALDSVRCRSRVRSMLA